MLRQSFSALILLTAAVAAACSGAASAQTGSAFTFQGRATNSGAPINGTANIQLSLWKDAFSSSIADRVGNVQTLNSVPVTNGIFTVLANSLNEFGTNPFNGDARWLQVAINGNTILPRQFISTTPYAAGLAPGGGARNNSSGTTTFSLTNLSTNTTASTANALFVQRGDPSGISVSGYYPGALRVDSANINGIVSTNASSAGYAVFGYSTGASAAGVAGRTTGNNASSILAEASGTNASAVKALSTGPFGTAIFGSANDTENGYAGYFDGRVLSRGNVGIGKQPQAPLDIRLGDLGESIQFRFDSVVPGLNVDSTGGNAGIMRFRNGLEIWPSDDATRAGRLDLRNTAGSPTVVLEGATGNITANNLPAVGYARTTRDSRNRGSALQLSPGANTLLNTLTINIPASGHVVFTCTMEGEVEIAAGEAYLELQLEETTGGPAVVLTRTASVSVPASPPLYNFSRSVQTISYALPVVAGSRSFKITAFYNTDVANRNARIYSTAITAVFFPKGL